MKRLEDIERMSPEDLDRIAGASGAEIPADLGERLGNAVLAAAAAEDCRSARRTRFGYAAGAVTAVRIPSTTRSSPMRNWKRHFHTYHPRWTAAWT